jgi:hypothetical protein
MRVDDRGDDRLAITSVLNIKAVFDKVREKTKELMEPDRDTYFPFVARVMYPHQFITREETANEYSPSLTGGSGVDDGGGNPSASGASASGSGSSSSLLAVSPSKPARRGVKISEDVDESDGGHKRECGRPTPRPAAEFPILSVMEGELVTVVKKVPGSKLWYDSAHHPHHHCMCRIADVAAAVVCVCGTGRDSTTGDGAWSTSTTSTRSCPRCPARRQI